MEHLHFFAGLVVLAEALNKLERTHPLAPGMSTRERLVDALNALAWALMAIGAGGAVATPSLFWFGVQGGHDMLMRLEKPTLAETSVLCGFAVLIVRTRIKEG